MTRAPGPAGSLLLGSLRDLSRDILGTITAAQRQYGDVLRFRLGTRTLHVACHPDQAQEVLVAKRDSFVKFSQVSRRNSVAIVLGDGLLSSHGAYWQRQRRMMQPIFHSRSVAGMAPQIVDAGARLTARWRELAPAQPILDVSREMAQVTLDVISQTMFGTAVDQRAVSIQETLDTASQYVFDRVRNPLMAPQGWPTRRNREFRAALATLDEVVLGIISQRLHSGESHEDLLQMLLEARDSESGEAMTPRQLRDEVATIFSAGHETTAAALSWTWYLLSVHPQAEQRLHAELDAVLGGRTPGAADCERLPYTRAVFEEAMRLYPPGPLIPRGAARAETLGGYEIPAHTLVMVSIYHIHHHPDLWHEPERFDPGRFMDPDKRPSRQIYLPFSIGQRMCIGSHLAMLEGTLLLAQIAQRFRLSNPAPEVPVEALSAITLRPRHRLKLRLHSR